jgi:hypothetical protein
MTSPNHAPLGEVPTQLASTVEELGGLALRSKDGKYEGSGEEAAMLCPVAHELDKAGFIEFVTENLAD